jgi:eukaryotic-like serine/threonine-protein kinase
MGVVYRAHDERLDREVALKLIPPEQFDDEAARKRFHQEARTLSRLSHPNIATLLDFDSDRVQYIVMELVAGVSLRQKLSQGALTTREIIPIGIQIAQGLAAAHQVGVVHRDLKPENVMITEDGHVKILDFGLARFAPRDRSATTTTASYMSEPGVISGTLPYMAPEQLRGEPPEPSFDIYSAGAVLYEMAAGRRPFDERGAMLMEAILNLDPPAPSVVNPRASPGLDPIILKALDKDPRRRYHSARELAIDLERQTTIGMRPPATSKSTPVRNWKLVMLALAVLALLIAGTWRWTRRSGPDGVSGTGSIQSIAVLPLQNISGDPQQEYFADGMTEELTSDLAKISALRVISRTSVMQYKNTRKTVPQIAAELNVDAVIEGSVLRAGDRVRITAQLINSRLDRHMWSQSYERELRDVLTLQSQVAQAIVGEIKVALTPQERGRLTQALAVNPAAYDAYLRGKFHAYRKNRQDTKEAIKFLEQAIALDPSFAAAYAWLAGCYDTQVTLFNPEDRASAEKALALSRKALELDPNSADAHLWFGRQLWTPQQHFAHQEAIQELRRAIALNPNLDEAHHQLGVVYMHIGLLDEAMAEFRKTVELNPANLLAYYRIGGALMYQGKHQEALDQSQRVPLEAQPSLVMYQNAWAKSYLKRETEALQETAEFLKKNSDEGGLVASTRAILYAMRGEEKEAGQEIQNAIARRGHFIHFHHTAYNIASAYAIMRRSGPALNWLRQAAADGYPCYPLFAHDAHLDNLRGDPEFVRFLADQKRLWESNKALAAAPPAAT